MQGFKDMNKWLRFGLSAVVALVLLFAMVFEVSVPLPVFDQEPAPSVPVVGESQAVRERIAIDTGEDSYIHSGADLTFYSDDHSTATITMTGDAGAIQATTLTVTNFITSSTDLALSGDLQVGDGTPTVTQDGEDAYVEGQFEVDGEAQFDGTVDINGAVAIDGGVTNIGGGTPAVATGDNDLYVTGDLEVDGELELDGALDADSTSNFSGMATFTAGLTGAQDVENVMFPTVVSTAITYTAGAGTTGALATVADGEIWLVHSVFIQTTETFTDTAGDDETFVIGDSGDADGFLSAGSTELASDFTEATGFAAGFYGIESGSQGAYTLDDGGPFVIAASGADHPITYTLASGAGDDIGAGALTMYLLYTRIQ